MQRATEAAADSHSTAEGHLLCLENITKRYAGLLALDRVNLTINSGEVHGLFGQNGAGKSTLIQIVAGDIQPSSGQITLNGEAIKIRSVHHARELGISAVFQEFSLIPQLSVEENLFLGSEFKAGPFLKKKRLRESAVDTLARLGFALDPQRKVMHLSRAEQQMVEIAKAFRSKPSIMILDEPTASLTEREAERLFSMIDVLKEDGIGVIYISHRISEIYRICDRITVLRDGRTLITDDVAVVDKNRLVETAVGRPIVDIEPPAPQPLGHMLLDIKSLELRGKVVDGVSLSVRSGEVVGIAGLVGSGKSEVGRACYGLQKIAAGKITYLDDVIYDDAERINDITPGVMLDRGMFYLPQDRRIEGLVMNQSVRENVSLSSLGLAKFSSGFLLHRQSERDIVGKVTQQLGIAASSIERSIEHLSGGNQQKVMVAKSFVRDVRLFILDEPTVGVDVGARAAIYQLIRDVSEAGAGVLLISSDVSEIVQITHRSYVMHRGRLLAELPRGSLSEQTLHDYFYDQRVDAL